MPDDDDAPFYVGFLPVPRRMARFLWLVAVVQVGFFVVSATLLARTMTDPGPAIWDDGVAKEFRGTLWSVPFPMLVEDNGRASMLVEMGKRGVHNGATRPVRALVGMRVVVSGWTLDRDGRRIIELEPGEDALRADRVAPSHSASAPTPLALGRITLRGEIVDSKCFLGAMKPGDGKTHKACATLCVKGGIPPMLVSRGGGSFDYTLIVGHDGEPLDDKLWPWIAEPVAVRGELELIGGVRRLRVEPEGITSALDARR